MIAIIKYNAGNVQSVRNALNRLGIKNIITDNVYEIKNADKVILPGVGEASSAMAYLKSKGLDVVIKNLTQPFLGICLGMQLLCEHSEEGNTKCLGIFNTRVKKFPPKDKVPHMGWNSFNNQSSLLLKGIEDDSDVYYVHSFYAELCTRTTAETNYILPFSAMLEKNNFYATQFHPEKSAGIGEQILKNFIDL
jgi:glutamine amidotransferase